MGFSHFKNHGLIHRILNTLSGGIDLRIQIPSKLQKTFPQTPYEVGADPPAVGIYTFRESFH